jgi:hypothetical protein
MLSSTFPIQADLSPLSHPAQSGAQKAFDRLPPLVREGVHEALAAIRSIVCTRFTAD